METLLVREQHLQTITAWSTNLVRVLPEMSDGQLDELDAALVGECVQCGIEVRGREFIAVAKCALSDDATSKVGRLRFSYCARKGCNSYFYKLKFYPHPQFNWPELLVKMEKAVDEPAPEEIAELALQKEQTTQHRKRTASIVDSLVVALVIGVVAFQWYHGGTIPLLREPEKFKVDPQPDFETLYRYDI